ncbi:MASE3 domain-containing protein [Candidatus Caldatribacterium sp.]|uniref:sensor domain-containing diguanylate cyclase n=1 Tax=Candidatus Caldatribacterium sp. TaxID=2282143 RepID=UPI002996C4D6|nr:diguanylate cyclase [Candidatus Caldatribacterium sp.]MDW8081498.1 MASE3 domain-containing protein [Candidatus Calescibacterium sp.]
MVQKKVLFEVIASGGILFLSFLTSQWNFLLFHTAIELYSVIVAVLIFVIAFSSKHLVKSGYFPFLGVAYLFVAFLDFVHTLAYKGMQIFPGITANVPTQLWIAARYMESVSLCVAPFFLQSRLKVLPVFLALTLLTALSIAAVFVWGIFPDCYLEGYGLTTFKKVSEYIISGILALGVLILWKFRKHFDFSVFRFLVASILSTIGSELFFTFYVSVYGISNVIGHLLKLLSFYLIYKAVVQVSLEAPHRSIFFDLLREAQQFQSYIEHAGILFLVLDRDGKVVLINRKGVEILGYPREAIVGKDWFANFLPEDVQRETKEYFLKLLAQSCSQEEVYHENPIKTRHGIRIMRWHNTLLCDEKGETVGILSSAEDITEEKIREIRLAHFASVDALTGVYNKRTGYEILERELSIALLKKSPLAVAFVDVDHLKMVNDTFGHLEGDAYLKVVAQVLKESVRKSDTVFRFGGDEFVLVLPQCTEGEVWKIFERVEEKLRVLTQTFHKAYAMSVSFGVAVFDPERPSSLEDLLVQADNGMYAMKSRKALPS